MDNSPFLAGHQSNDALLRQRLHALLPGMAARADALDAGAAPYPAEDIVALAGSGLLTAPLPPALGGEGWGTERGRNDTLMTALRFIGRASLPVGRLYEGHVNALRLVMLHGDTLQRKAAAEATRSGQLFGVWNAEEAGSGPWFDNGPGGQLRLHGQKIFCSGAGLVSQALITARQGQDGQAFMLLVPLGSQQHRADLAPWTASGMRASATGHFDFEGMLLTAEMVVGGPDAYFVQPDFSSGAWRFLAVQLGGAEALGAALREYLLGSGRGSDPQQAARFGQVMTALETARLWVSQAAALAERPGTPPSRLLAYVDLARGAVERAALEVLELSTRSIGLSALCRPSPVERITRDLSTYLRQPGPDRALLAGAAACLADAAAPGDIWFEEVLDWAQPA